MQSDGVSRVSGLGFQPKKVQTHFLSPTTALAFNIDLSQAANACSKHEFCRMHVASILEITAQDATAAGCFVTFDIATIVCDGSDTPLEKEEKERECR